MKVLDLFSGIGGFSLGLQWAGFETIAFCEIDEFCRSVIADHWPGVPIHDDIRRLDGYQYRGAIDLVCGGFPCQPHSVAGKQKGAEDDRDLWPEMFRVVREVLPQWVIGENVPGLDDREFMALDGVLSDLESIGYAAIPFVIPACAVNRPHRRDRFWIVANRPMGDAQRPGPQIRQDQADGSRALRDEGAPVGAASLGELQRNGAVGDTRRDTRGRDPGTVHGTEGGSPEETRHGGILDGPTVASEGDFIRTFDGKYRRVKPGVCPLVDGLPGRVAQIRALGNSVVPQIPYAIGRSIMGAQS